jgi:undecaprenyl-diphosphatase
MGMMRSFWQSMNDIDLSFTERVRLDPRHAGWRAAVFLAHSGDSWLWAIGVGLFWLFGLGGPSGHRFSALLEISIVLQALFVFALKAVIKRRRPEGTWGTIYRQYDPHSFPSGHATRAVMLAVLAAGFSPQLSPAWFAWFMAVWAPLVCISRVLTGLHYLTDIPGGMLLGLLLGLLFIAISPLWMAWFPFLF